ncbi:hypothetical protein AVEN_66808-1 [Araneus ventricosus]|uniref:Uncharacterized protein n=1 Tax=Araneus ventricosus TaxID=182803 RepID=A0A4Y2DNT1_ARAVE|nr:hypothetical protein AVEN_66808-1 [Araneus ventricosus]
MTRTIPELALHSPSFRATPAGGHLALTDLACTRPAYTAVLWWNRISNLEPSDHQAAAAHQWRMSAVKYNSICAYESENIVRIGIISSICPICSMKK